MNPAKSPHRTATSPTSLATQAPAPGTLTIEVVDDTGQANAPYLLLVGKSVTAGQPASAVATPMNVAPGLGQLAQAAADSPYVPASVTATVSESGGIALALASGGSGYQSVAGAPIPVSLIGGTAKAENEAQAIATFGSLAITIVDGGAGYTSAPSIVLSGGGGSGATATATVSGGKVSAITVTNQGSGYVSAPVVTFSGGGGSGAVASAAFGSASLQGIAVLAGGSGYSSAPAVTLSGGGGTGATAKAILNGTAVASITLTNPGEGYTSAPTVTLSGGGCATAATAIAIFGRSVAGITVTDPGSGYTQAPAASVPNSINPLPADLLAATGASVVSPYSGQTRVVRSFEVSTLGSGAFMVFANDGSGESPFTYSDNANPTTGSAFRFDQCEITFDAAIQSGANLTSINALSMPMKFELFDSSGQGDPVDERTFHASLSDILALFPSGQSGALMQQGTNGPVGGWTPADGMTGFLRALGPGEIAAVSDGNPSGSPAPYPSFASYLGALAALAPSTPATATATITGGSVASVAVTGVGSNYSSPPAVSFTGGGGSGATGFATLNADNVVSVTVTSGGSGYATPPDVVFSVGGGSGAAATTTISGGAVTAVGVSAGGSGYISAPSVVFTGGGGSGATGVAQLTNGVVTGVNVTSGGSGYTSAPTISFTAGTGSGASAIASIATGLAGLSLGGGGSGYKAPPAVTITGGGGFGATAVATLDAKTGAVASLVLTGAGSGYTSAPTVNFSAFNVSGSANGSDYNYGGDVVTAANGWQIVLNGTTFAANTGSPYAGAGLPASATVTVNLPTVLAQATATATVNASGNVTGVSVTAGGRGYMTPPLVTIAAPSGSGNVAATATAVLSGDSVASVAIQNAGSGYDSAHPPVVTVSQPAGSLDTFIYGATLSADSFAVAGVGSADIAADTNIVYGAIARDALAALNFGYLGGNWGETGQQWFGAPPSSYPFGLARPAQDDGFYNPYAALLYNTSDAYGFAFSDRIAPSPLITIQPGQVLRITLLPDTWGIAAPQPTVTADGATDTTLELQWPAVPGATGYQITVLDPAGIVPLSVPAASGTVTATLGDGAAPLSPGTPYTITVAALGATTGGDPVSAVSQPLQISTTGTPASVSGATTFTMTFGFVPAPFLLAGAGQVTGLIGGQPISYAPGIQQWQVAGGGSGVPLQAVEGTNTYPFTISDQTGRVIFAGNATVDNQSGALTGAYYKGGTLSVAGSGPGTVMSIILPPPSPLKAFAPVTF